MFGNFNSIESENKRQNIFKYSKIGGLVLVSLIVVLLLFRSCNPKSSQYINMEEQLIDSTKSMAIEDNIDDGESIYIDLYTLETETKIGTLKDNYGYICDKSSGVLISKINQALTYTPYLICGDYQSSAFPTNKENNYIELKGANNIIINTNDDYIEPGFTISNDVSVEVVGSVLKIPGLYTLQYRATKNNQILATVERTIIVTEEEVLVSQQDQNTIDYTSADAKIPIINLKGNDIINLKIGEIYNEPGFSAYDKKDGDITDNVQILGSVDSTKAYSYTITYQIRNSLGYQNSKQRTVIVAPQATNLNIISSISPNTSTKEDVTINLSISGNGYNYTVLPNGNKNYSQSISYLVSNNGIYSFYIYDQNNNVSDKQVMVNNIDNDPPLAACSATYENNKTTIKVNNLNNEAISYSYSLGSNYSNFTNQKTYSFNQKGTVAFVKAKDNVGNIRHISCNVVDKNPAPIVSTPTGSSCDLGYIKVNVKDCFNGVIQETINFTDYLRGVVYGEEDVDRSNDEEFLKAFIIFARTYSFFRSDDAFMRSDLKNNTLNIRNCDSDQNYCNIYQGCYRYQTQDMFNSCMNYSMRNNGTYTPKQCANRVTTYAGNNSSINTNTTYAVSSEITNNHNWNSSWPTRVQSSRNTKRWKPVISQKGLEELNRLITETDGLVMYDKNGKLAYIHYIGSCSYASHGNQMCADYAYKMSQQGKSYQEIIRAYAKDYPNYKIACYKGKTVAN